MMPPTERNPSKGKKSTSKQQQQRLETDIKNNNTFHHRHHKSLTVDKINQNRNLDHPSNKTSYARNDNNSVVTTTHSSTTDQVTSPTTGRMIATTSIVSNSLSQDHATYNLRPRNTINGLPLDDTHEEMNNDQRQHHTTTSINSLYHPQLQHHHHHRHHPSSQRGEGARYHQQPPPPSTTITQHTHNLTINSNTNRLDSQHQHSNSSDSCIGGNEENQDVSPSHHHHASGQLHSMTKYRRLKANARERSRMSKMNVAFEELRRLVPYYPKDGKLTKLTTLRLAMRYISALSELLQEDDQRRADLDKGQWPNENDGAAEKRIRNNFYRQLTEKENYR